MPWKWEIPGRFNIARACLDRHLGTPAAGRAALVVERAGEASRQATYGELAKESGKFAGLLGARGVGPGDRVLLRLPNCLDFPIAFFGCLKAGAIAVPSSPLLTAEELGYLLNDSGARVLVADKRMWTQVAGAVENWKNPLTVLLAGEGLLPKEAPAHVEILDLALELSRVTERQTCADTKAEDPAYLVYTSGTTGYPKGVLHAHRALLGRLPAMEHWFDFRPDYPEERVLHAGKFNWTYVLGTGLMDPLYMGKTAVVYEGPNDPGTWMDLIARQECTTFIGVPTVYRQILERTSVSGKDVPTLRHCMCAGESLPLEVFEKFQERFGIEIREGLGMSEISYYICQPKGAPVRLGPAGKAQPGHDVRLLDENLKEVPVGEEGMLCIPEKDPELFLKYWNDPEGTAATRGGGYFLTGDYARRDAEGYLYFLGRKDDIIKSFGYRVSPFEVERVLKGHPGILDCAVVGEEIGPGKTLIAACVIAAPGSALTEEQVLDYGARHLASYKVPKRAHFLGDFPRTRNGKVLRSRLREMLAARGGKT